jgi:DNA polymerase-3 subunit delta
VAAIRELIPGRSTASDFELAEQLLSGKRGATEVLLNKLVLQGSSPFMLIGLLAKTFGSLVRIRALLDKGLSSQEIKEDLGISPWLLNKYLPLAKRASLQILAEHLSALLKADFRLKDRSLNPAAVFGTLAHDISREHSHGR